MGSVLQDKGKHCQNSNSAIPLVEHLLPKDDND
jgi:hypothetical protein